MTYALRTTLLGTLLLSPTLGVLGASAVEGQQSVPGSEWSGGGLTILSDNHLDSKHRDLFAPNSDAD